MRVFRVGAEVLIVAYRGWVEIIGLRGADLTISLLSSRCTESYLRYPSVQSRGRVWVLAYEGYSALPKHRIRKKVKATIDPWGLIGEIAANRVSCYRTGREDESEVSQDGRGFVRAKASVVG